MERTQEVVLANMVMIKDRQGRILVEDRKAKEWPGLAFPGGHVEPGESFYASAVREVKEETGLDISDLKMVGIKQDIWNGLRYIVFLYETENYRGSLESSDEGPVFWIERKDLASYRLSPEFDHIVKVMEDPALSEAYGIWNGHDWDQKEF